MARFVVAIDGTAGSGKSTTAQALAQRLNFFYLDTGAMYRAFTLNLIRNGFALNIDKIKNLLAKTRIDLVKAQNGYQVLLNGQDVSLEIRTPEVNEKVSQVSAIFRSPGPGVDG
ncbi:MAG: (d)CMP kinase [candidate division WOR-3 bacterium]